MYHYIQSCYLFGDLPRCGNLTPQLPIEMTSAPGGRLS